MEKKEEIYIDTITGEKLTKETDNNGDIRYYNSKDQQHRTDGPAIEYSNGTRAWYRNDKLHRIDNPAVEYSNGSKTWWVNGKRHNLNGPAIIYSNGDKEWWIDGKEYTELEFNIYVRKEKLKNL